jgi:prepilin-type processing-associated H-X9-DG protein
MQRRAAVSRETGISLIEMLVVLSILSILGCLLVPAVQSAREASRSARCANNLRQLGLANHSYHGVFESLPPGRIKSYDPRFAGRNPPCTSLIVDKSVEVFLLGFLEQNTVYNAINQSLAIVGAENSTIHSAGVSVFACPSDTAAGWPRELYSGALAPYGVPQPALMVFTSYAGMMGSLSVTAQPLPENRCTVPPALVAQCNGVFNDLAPVRLASVTDGLSNTVFIAEKASVILEEFIPPNPEYASRRCWWITGNLGDTLLSALYPPNACDRVSGLGLAAWSDSASSMHPSGVNVLMGDGSVRFVKDSVQTWPFDPITGKPVGSSQNAIGAWMNLPPSGVWQALSTRAGGEVVGSDND